MHFKCSGTDNWGKAATALKMIADARARGLDVDCDAYPYAAGSNPLKNLLPQWVQSGGVEAMIARLKQPDTRTRIRADIERDGLNNWGRILSWDCVQISISPHLPQFAGRTILSLAGERKQDPVDTLCDYLADDQGATRVLVTSISEDDIDPDGNIHPFAHSKGNQNDGKYANAEVDKLLDEARTLYDVAERKKRYDAAQAENRKLIDEAQARANAGLGDDVVQGCGLGRRVLGVRADVEVEARAVVEEDVARTPPRDDLAEQRAAHLVGRQATLAVRRRGDAELRLDAVDAAFHGCS